MKVHVVGAGFSGLASAYFLTKAGHQVEVFEQSPGAGGLIQTVETPWGLCETAANGILNSVLLEEMAADIGLKLIAAQKVSSKRFIYRRRLRRWPLGFLESLRVLWKFLTNNSRTPLKGETVEIWAQRVFGQAMLDWLLAPALQGIYAGDPQRLSASLIFSRFFKKTKKQKPVLSGLVAPEKGMGEFSLRLKEYLETQGVIFNFGRKYDLNLKNDSLSSPVVICTSLPAAASLLKAADLDIAAKLGTLEVLPIVSVTLFYPLSSPSLKGFGCLFPRQSAFRVLGVLANDHIFSGRSSEHSETWIFGGASDKTFIQLSDEELLKTIRTEREKLYKKNIEPLGYRIQRWPQALPHYTLELENFLEGSARQILAQKNIYLMGNYLGSMGLSQILERARELPALISKKHGLILINLGTPEDPSEKSVKTYLREFLMDPFVIDIPFLFRWFLVNILILKNRPKNSALAYEKIWSDRGSPLLFNTLDLSEKVQKTLEKDFIVVPAMRYGQPSISEALQKLKSNQVEKIFALPLYPQYSLAATESCIQECRKQAQKLRLPEVSFLPPFYDEKSFINSFVQRGSGLLNEKKPDHVLFSFHGLPERHVKKTDHTKTHCLASKNCCDAITEANKNCYRAQCFATARSLAKELGLAPEDYTVSFQSRLGRTPWVKPYTDFLYEELAQKGKKKVLLFSPSFVADCLETVEEISIRGDAAFKTAGGEELWLVPSLNSEDSWAQAVSEMAQREVVGMLATQRS